MNVPAARPLPVAVFGACAADGSHLPSRVSIEPIRMVDQLVTVDEVSGRQIGPTSDGGDQPPPPFVIRPTPGVYRGTGARPRMTNSADRPAASSCAFPDPSFSCDEGATCVSSLRPHIRPRDLRRASTAWTSAAVFTGEHPMQDRRTDDAARGKRRRKWECRSPWPHRPPWPLVARRQVWPPASGRHRSERRGRDGRRRTFPAPGWRLAQILGSLSWPTAARPRRQS
jgi:hypothetical protein